MTTETTETRALSRADILGADDRRTETIHVPAWGGTVTVRALSGSERDAYEGSGIVWGRNDQGAPIVESMSTDNVRARLVALAVVDERGERLFTQADVVALGRKNAQALDTVFDLARRLSGLTKADVEALSTGLKVAPIAPSGSD